MIDKFNSLPEFARKLLAVVVAYIFVGLFFLFMPLFSRINSLVQCQPQLQVRCAGNCPIGNPKFFTDNHFRCLNYERYGDVKTVNLRGSSVSDEGVKHLLKFPQLKRLNLAKTQVTDASIATITQLSNLESLDLSGTNVFGSRLMLLRNLPKLSKLSLKSTEINDFSVQALAKLSSLKTLELQSSKVTRYGMAKLQEKNPYLLIKHRGASRKANSLAKRLRKEH